MNTPRVDLRKYAWLSIAAAVATIALKAGAWWITKSVGLLSDAAESTVNLAAAIVALMALTIAARPADEGHPYGHTKAEYFSAAAEGQMIVFAAIFIVYTAVERLLHPQPLENIGAGLLVSVVASIINGSVAMILLRAGRAHKSLTLVADGKHLLTDVWTSVGVLVGVGLVWVTKLTWLDPVVALLVGLNIIITGYHLLQQSAAGLMDSALPNDDNTKLAETLRSFSGPGIAFHGLRTRHSGHQSFADVHVLLPGDWSVQRAHDLVEDVEAACREHGITLQAHIEPIEDPRSYADYSAEVIAVTERLGPEPERP